MKTIVLLVLLAAVTGCATSPGRTRDAAAVTGSSRAFIEETAIDVPERFDGAALINVMREADAGWGVNAFYRLDALPQARLDLFVYPAGRMPAAQGSRRGQDTFTSELEYVRTQGLGTFEVVGEEPFRVALANGATLNAFKTRLWIEVDGHRRASRAYIAWRRDYFLKLRMTVDAGDEQTLDTWADRSARELFSRVQIRNRGACQRIVVHKVDVLPPGQPGVLDAVSADGAEIVLLESATKKQLADAFVTSALRLQETGCIGESGLPDPDAGFKRQTLRFKAADWMPGARAGAEP